MELTDRFAGDINGTEIEAIARTCAQGLGRRTARAFEVEDVQRILREHFEFAASHDRIATKATPDLVTNNYNGGKGGESDWLTVVSVGRTHRVVWSRGRAKGGSGGHGVARVTWALDAKDEREPAAILAVPGSPPSRGDRRLKVESV